MLKEHIVINGVYTGENGKAEEFKTDDPAIMLFTYGDNLKGSFYMFGNISIADIANGLLNAYKHAPDMIVTAMRLALYNIKIGACDEDSDGEHDE